ncbi:methyl-accepting chemotaxis protein [Planctellipticum variicoloris]|uniref:methyl-accepting chemotaxis protein n=1 Tax=Planctellipticum variicoloris TaxID=3064265 RepID=UPI003013B0F9|nr:methyl-accepting chemotaxis protein [Planctomycetaceae bacterium SH412]
MNWFRNLKTQSKLMVSFAIVCVITGTMGSLGIHSLSSLRENLRIVYADYTVAATDVAKAGAALAQYRNLGVIASGAKDEAEHDRALREQMECAKTLSESMEAYAATTLRVSRAGRNESKDLDAFRAALKEYFAAAGEVGNTSRQAWGANTDEERVTLQNRARELSLTKSGPALDKALAALRELVATITDVAGDMNNDGQATATAGFWTLSAGTVTAIALSLLLGVMIARIISRPLIATVEILNAVAAGDFTKSLDVGTKDEIGQMAAALNSAVGGMRNALTDVRRVADALATAAPQLSAASEEISSGAQEQASSLEETASSLEEITSTVKQNADNAQQANQLACRSREVAEKGGQVVHNAVEGMNEINKASKKIADIITAIDEIAFQTNLLALNAAVEAARAGEQGRGFAVVAGEVRNLAQRSAAAAKEIKGLIQDSVRKVETGTELVNQSGQTLQEIVTSVKRVTDIVAEIAAASREQSTGIDQVSRAVAQMDQVTQGNASQTEELSGTAESLAGQAQELQQLVARFVLGNEPAAKAPVTFAARPAARKPAAAPKRASAAKAFRPEPSEFRKVTDEQLTHELDLVGASVNSAFEEF